MAFRRVETRVQMLSNNINDLANDVIMMFKRQMPNDPMMNDPEVLKFIQLSVITAAAEKDQFINPWTPEQKQLYKDKNNWEEFSRSRGYTEQEINDFKEYLRLWDVIYKRYGDNAYNVSNGYEEYYDQDDDSMFPPHI